MAREIELGGHRYSIGRLSARQQFHVSRRIAPVIPPLIPVFLQLARHHKEGAGELDGLGEVLQPFAAAIAAMNDADADYVMDNCLLAVQRWQDTGWARVMAPEQKTLMFQDMDMSVILPLVVQTVVANLGPFINGLLISQASSPEAATAAG